MLLNIMIADLERKLEKWVVDGVRVGGERIWVLGYADDLVLLAKNEEGMRWMMRALEPYLNGKGLRG